MPLPSRTTKRTAPLLVATMAFSGLLLAGCDEHVDVVRDHSVNIPKHATWAWRPADATPKALGSPSPDALSDRSRKHEYERNHDRDHDRDYGHNDDRSSNSDRRHDYERDGDRARDEDSDRDRDDRRSISRDVFSSDGGHETVSRDNHVNDETLRLELRTDIEQILASKGFRLVSDPQSADFLVDYHFAIDRHARTERRYLYGPAYGFGYGYPGLVCGPFGCWESLGWGYGGWGYSAPYGYEDIRFREGTFIFDFVKRSSNKVAFRAVGHQRMTHSSFSSNHIHGAIERLLRDLKHGKN